MGTRRSIAPVLGAAVLELVVAVAALPRVGAAGDRPPHHMSAPAPSTSSTTAQAAVQRSILVTPQPDAGERGTDVFAVDTTTVATTRVTGVPPFPAASISPTDGAIARYRQDTDARCAFPGCLTRPIDTASITVANADGSDEHQVIQFTGPQTPVWSPSGDLLLVTVPKEYNGFGQRYAELVVVNRDGLVVDHVTPPAFTDGAGTWSPDGRSLAVLRRPRKGNIGQPPTVTLVTLYSHETREVSTDYYMDIAWSRDGASLVAVTGGHKPDGQHSGFIYLENELVLIPLYGGAPRRLTQFTHGRSYDDWCQRSSTIAFTVKSPVWSLDGRIAYLTNERHVGQDGGQFDIAVIDPRTGESRVVYNSAPDTCERGFIVHAGLRPVIVGWRS